MVGLFDTELLNVAQGGLELQVLLPHKCWDDRCMPPCLVPGSLKGKIPDSQAQPILPVSEAAFEQNLQVIDMFAHWVLRATGQYCFLVLLMSSFPSSGVVVTA